MTPTATETGRETVGTGAYADVNGLHLYYEIHGTGRPLVLLHGGLGAGETLEFLDEPAGQAPFESRP